MIVLLFFAIRGHALGTEAVPGFSSISLPLTMESQRKQGIPGGEGFQMVMSIVYSSSNPSVVFLASDTSQVWKSIDSGKSWAPRNNGYVALGSRSLFVHPLDENVVFSAASLGKTFKRSGMKMPYQGIYRSADGGANWTMVFETGFYKQESRGSLFAIDSRTLHDKNFTLYAGSYSDGLLVSHDAGLNWRKAGFNEGKIQEILEVPDAPGHLLIATDSGLFLYDGKAQRQLGAGLATWPRSIAVSPDRPNVVFAAQGTEGLYQSVDGGRHFAGVTGMPRLSGSVNDVEISPVDADVAIFTVSGKGGKPYFTDDGGQRWRGAQSTNSKGLHAGGGFYFPSPIAMHPEDANTALTSSNGKSTVLVTRNGGRDWTYSGSGYRGGRLRDIVFYSPVEMIFSLTDHGAWRTSNGGLSFNPLSLPRMDGRSVGGGAHSVDTIVLSVGSWKSKQLLVSKDDGNTWSDTNLKGSFTIVENPKESPKTFYAGQYRSDDMGKSWEKLAHEVTAVDPNNFTTIYAKKDTKAGVQLLVSTDSGASWKELGGTLPDKSAIVNSIDVDQYAPGRIFAATSNGIWVLDDQWHAIGKAQGLAEDAFGGNYVETVVSHPGVPGLILAGKRSPGKGMANGLFYSIDHGHTWEPVPGEGLSNTNIWSVNINPYDGVIYVGTSHGIYRVELTAGTRTNIRSDHQLKSLSKSDTVH